MTLKVQGVWEAERVSAVLRAAHQASPGDRWLKDLCERISRQVTSERERRDGKSAN